MNCTAIDVAHVIEKNHIRPREKLDLSRKHTPSQRSHTCRGYTGVKRKSRLTFAELLFEIGIAAAFLVEVEAVADEDPGDADGNANRGFGNHGHSNIQISNVLQRIHELLITTSAIMEKKVDFLVVRAEHAREIFARGCANLTRKFSEGPKCQDRG